MDTCICEPGVSWSEARLQLLEACCISNMRCRDFPSRICFWFNRLQHERVPTALRLSTREDVATRIYWARRTKMLSALSKTHLPKQPDSIPAAHARSLLRDPLFCKRFPPPLTDAAPCHGQLTCKRSQRALLFRYQHGHRITDTQGDRAKTSHTASQTEIHTEGLPDNPLDYIQLSISKVSMKSSSSASSKEYAPLEMREHTVGQDGRGRGKEDRDRVLLTT